MILGQELLDHGIKEDALGLPIDKGAPYNLTIEGKWYRAGLVSRSRLSELQRPWEISDERNERPPHHHTMREERQS